MKGIRSGNHGWRGGDAAEQAGLPFNEPSPADKERAKAKS